MRFYYWQLLIAIGCFETVLTKQPRNVFYFWDSINCTGNERYISNTKCSVRESDHRTFSMQTTFLKDINNVQVIFRIYFPRNGVWNSKPTLEVNLSLCALLEGSAIMPFMKIIHEPIRRFSNLPRKCPMLKNVEYYVRNFTLIAKDVPSFVPLSNFYCEIKGVIPAKGPLVSIEIKGRLALK